MPTTTARPDGVSTASASMPQIFRSPASKIVRPLDVCFNSASFVQCVANSNCDHESDKRPLILRDGRPQKNAEIEPRALRRRPRALQTAATGRLFVSHDCEAFRRAVCRKSRQLGVGGRQRLEAQNLWLEQRHSGDAIVSFNVCVLKDLSPEVKLWRGLP